MAASKLRVAILAGAALLTAAAPGWAAGKKEGAGESGGTVVAPIDSVLDGPHDQVFPSEMASQSLGNVVIAATMMAGAGAGKCRMNFVIRNQASAAIALGAIATVISANGEVVENWVLSIGALPANGQTARLFSCGLGAAKLIMAPLADFGWPPVKCAKPDQEPEACPVGLQITSSLPMGSKSEIKQGPAQPEEKHH